MSATKPPSPDGPAASQRELPSGHLRWRFAQVELNEAQLQLTVRNEPREIEPRPLQALMFFLRHAGEVVTKDELLENLWPGRIVTEASLTVCVAKLRQALDDDDQALIRTVHGYGYRFSAPVAVETIAAPLPALENLRLSEGSSPPLRPNWRLLRRLGVGGFGEAWLCQHSKTREQRVFKFSADGAQLSALKREVTLFRLLNDELGERPDLLRLLDWNFEVTPFFIELEHCPDGSLADWAEAQGGIQQVALAQRLDLFTQITDCVAAAHSLGVLHKDLKPTNILITRDAHGKPGVKVADWGSGWILNAERLRLAGITRLGFTHAGSASDSGTLLYQPPEVRAGQPATVQGDIYGLGILLYQLVVGDFSRGLTPGWERDITDDLLREDIACAADGDLHRRPGDAAELSQRIRRLDARRAEKERLQRERNEAQEAIERIKILNLRRRWTWAVAATLLAGFAVSSVLYVDARRASRKAEMISNFLTKDLLSSANPGNGGGKDVKVRDILSTAEATMASRFAGDPETLLALQTALGGAYAGLDISERSKALLNPALETAIRIHGRNSSQAQAVREALLDLYVGQRDLDAIGKLADEALAIERLNGNADSEFALQIEQNQTALLCWKSGYTACQPAFQNLIERANRILGPDHEQSARMAITYSSVLAGVGRKEEGMALAEQGVQRLRKALGPDHPTVLTRSVYIGYLLQNSGRAAEAIQSLEQLLPKIEKAYGVDSEDATKARRMLALSYTKGGRAAEAIPILDKIYAARLQQFGEADTEARLIRRQRTVALHQVGRSAEAIRELDALLVLHQQDQDKDPDEKAELLQLRAKFSSGPARTPPQ